MKAGKTLAVAAALVTGSRARQNGDALLNHANIAAMWNAYLRIRREPAAPLSAKDVAKMMALLKMARDESGESNADDLIDACGYLAIACEIEGKEGE